MSCDDLSGTWINDLNSTMTIQHRYDGILEGNYGSQVEIYEGSAGEIIYLCNI